MNYILIFKKENKEFHFILNKCSEISEQSHHFFIFFYFNETLNDSKSRLFPCSLTKPPIPFYKFYLFKIIDTIFYHAQQIAAG